MQDELSYLPSQAHNSKSHLIIQLIQNLKFYILLSLKLDNGVLKIPVVKMCFSGYGNLLIKVCAVIKIVVGGEQLPYPA